MIEFLGYSELIDTFTFREKGAITIPKSVREEAYTLQVDLEIVSTARDGYKNYKSNPAFGFYGYAVIVLRNFAQIQIPIDQPRQVLYYDRLESAYANWYALYQARVASANLGSTQENVLVPIGAAVGVAFERVTGECLFPPTFVELPIREVYVKCPVGTTFKLEVSHWFPVPVAAGDCSYDGKSGQEDDPEKDGGLPPNGVQPQVANDPDTPYEGFPLPSTAAELGEFLNTKLDGLDGANSDNLPTVTKYWVSLYGTHKSADASPSCATLYSRLYYEIPEPNTPYNLIYSATAVNSCGGGTYGIYDVRNANTNVRIGAFGFFDQGKAIVTYGSGLELPTNIVESRSPIL